jgi:hypothetical protein
MGPVKMRSHSYSLQGPLGAPYATHMSRGITTTVRLDADDADALRKARADGFEASDLIRIGLRIAAARHYPKGRKPDLGLFGSVDAKPE